MALNGAMCIALAKQGCRPERVREGAVVLTPGWGVRQNLLDVDSVVKHNDHRAPLANEKSFPFPRGRRATRFSMEECRTA